MGDALLGGKPPNSDEAKSRINPTELRPAEVRADSDELTRPISFIFYNWTIKRFETVSPRRPKLFPRERITPTCAPQERTSRLEM